MLCCLSNIASLTHLVQELHFFAAECDRETLVPSPPPPQWMWMEIASS